MKGQNQLTTRKRPMKTHTKQMSLTDEELNMLIDAVRSTFHQDIKKGIIQLRLERKLKSWQEHPDLEFV
jgi:hypothetical protein